jgi:rhombotail lipoprotein
MARLIRPTLLVLTVIVAQHVAPRAEACDRCRPHVPPAGAPRIDTATLLRDLDQRAAASASARPHLTFPARIGVARIADGAVTSIPADEWAAWRALRDQMQPALGELTPVSPIVAQSLTTAPVSSTPHDAITNLRLAAAREQLDAILLYEVSTTHSLEQTELTLLDATIVGAWWFPTHKSHATAHASATLIDVRSGLAYGSAIGNASDVTSATRLGSEEKIHRQRAAATRKSVTALTPEVGAMMARLAQSPPRQSRPGEVSAPASVPVRAPAARPKEVGNDTVIPPPPADTGDSFWGSR